MKVVLQRVSKASVKVDGEITGEIENGLLVLASFVNSDAMDDLKWMSTKICNLRIFGDQDGKMNLSVLQTKYDILLVSQFTLHASTTKGNRPSFMKAAKPDRAKELYIMFHRLLAQELGKQVPTGMFGTDMKVALLNDGPVTIVIDSENK